MDILLTDFHFSSPPAPLIPPPVPLPGLFWSAVRVTEASLTPHLLGCILTLFQLNMMVIWLVGATQERGSGSREDAPSLSGYSAKYIVLKKTG